MMKKTIFAAGLSAILLLACGCGKESAFKRSDAAMGTIWDITIVSTDLKKAERASDEVFDEIKRLEPVLSLHDKGSELSRLNALAGTGPVKVSDDIVKVLKVSLMASEMTGGGFDVSIGPAVKLWGFAGGKEYVPSEAEIKAVRSLIGYKMIKLDEKNATVALEKKGMALDLGGVAKGYAVDRAAAILKKHGQKNVMLSAGGQIYVSGHNPKGKKWKIGVRHPRKTEDVLTVLNDTDKCIATSGDYEHYFKRKNKLYHHIFSVKSLRPSDEAISSTIALTKDSFEMPNTWADALSKVGFVMGAAEGAKLINGIKGAECIIVSEADGGTKITVSDNLKGKLEFNY